MYTSSCLPKSFNPFKKWNYKNSQKNDSCLSNLGNPFKLWKRDASIFPSSSDGSTHNESGRNHYPGGSQNFEDSRIHFLIGSTSSVGSVRDINEETKYPDDLRDLYDLREEAQELLDAQQVDIVNKKELAVEFASFLRSNQTYLSNFENSNRLDKSISCSRTNTPSGAGSPNTISSVPFEFNDGYRPFTLLFTENEDTIILVNTNKDGQSKTELGTGSYARVRLGYSVKHEKFVAIKKQNRSLEHAKNEYEMLVSIYKETVDRAVSLSKKGIKTSYIVMDLMDQDFYEYLQDNEKTPTLAKAIEKLEYFSLLIEKMSIIHSLGIVHRDIKPENMMVANNSVQIIDFGMSTTGNAKKNCGTPQFVSPEVYYDKISDASSDVWSLGCVFFDVLTGNMVPSMDKNNSMSPSKFFNQTYTQNQKDFFRIFYSKKDMCLNQFSDEDQGKLIDLLFSCIRYNPSERITSSELSTSLKMFLENVKSKVPG